MELVSTALYIFVLTALAVSAVAITLSHAKVSSGLRKWLNVKAPLFGSLLSCPYCVSHWLAFIIMFLNPLPIVAGGGFLNWLVGSFALVGAAAILSGIAMNVLHIHEDTIEALREALTEARAELEPAPAPAEPDGNKGWT